MVRGLAVLVSAAALAVLAGACTADAASAPGGAECGVTVDRFKEMIVVDPAVIEDPRASNELNGPWSFRHAVEEMVGAGETPSGFVLAWLDNWATTTTLNGFEVDRESRTSDIRTKLVCPWLRARAANLCDSSCTQCAQRELDFAKAPFRLISIVNRTDLRVRPDAKGAAGEGRLLFGMTRGPGDDPASSSATLTVAFEYALPESLPLRDWLDAWHHLGTHAAFDEGYKQELTRLTDRFVARGAAPAHTNGSAIAQIRTNESEFNWIWQLREFHLTNDGALRMNTLANTPGESLNNSAALRAFVVANADKIKSDTHVVPSSMLAGSADQLLYRWNVPGVDEPTRLAFARSTCNGCHSGERNESVNTAFHVSPFKRGTEKVSLFLNNPSDSEHDELARRVELMKRGLCEKSP